MVQHWPGDQVREIGHEQAVVDRIEFLRLAARRVDQEGDLREGEERDAQRENDRRKVVAAAGDRIDRVDEEVGVLVVAQQNQIARDTERQQVASALGADVTAARQCAPHGVVEDDRRQQ